MTLLAMLAAGDLAAQRGTPTRSAMATADSAWRGGDYKRARALYAEVLAADSVASRAVFRLAQLDESPERALALYRRYIALEPGDAWGHIAEGDLLARLGRWDEGLIAYAGAYAVAPGERDIALGRARLLQRAGRPQEAADELSAWTTTHADDGEAWDLLGRAYQRSGRPNAAAQAFEHAVRLVVPGASSRLTSARAVAAPAVSPDAGGTTDSDGNSTTRFGGSLDLMPADGLRLGASLHRHRIGRDLDAVRGTQVGVRVDAAVTAGLRAQAELGGMNYGASGSSTAWTGVRASARVRTRQPGNGPSMDLRLEHEPVGFNPVLVASHVRRSEARAMLELPVALLRARGTVRLGRFTATGESPNRRTSFEGAVLLPLGVLQPALAYRVAGFERASAAGYFAPRRAETIEGGAYWETGDDGRLSLAIDAGGGIQRVTQHRSPGQAPGPPGPHADSRARWSRVWRAWAQGAVAIAPARSWYVEVEAYDAPFALEGTGAGGSWRYLALTTGVRWSLR